MQRNRWHFRGFTICYNDSVQRRIVITLMTKYRKRIRTWVHRPDQVAPAHRGNSIHRIGGIENLHQWRCSRRQYQSFYPARSMIIECHHVGTQVKGAAPEKNRTFQIEVEPQFEFITADGINIFSPDVDIEIRMWAEHFQRITGNTIRKYSVV